MSKTKKKTSERKFRLRHPANYEQQDIDFGKEYTTKPSKTIPDDSMSMKEILTRYARGLPISGGKMGEFDLETEPEDPDFDGYPDPARMDMAERETVELLIKEELKDIDERVKAKQAWLAQKKKADKEKAEAEKEALKKAAEQPKETAASTNKP